MEIVKKGKTREPQKTLTCGECGTVFKATSADVAGECHTRDDVYVEYVKCPICGSEVTFHRYLWCRYDGEYTDLDDWKSGEFFYSPFPLKYNTFYYLFLRLWKNHKIYLILLLLEAIGINA